MSGGRSQEFKGKSARQIAVIADIAVIAVIG